MGHANRILYNVPYNIQASAIPNTTKQPQFQHTMMVFVFLVWCFSVPVKSFDHVGMVSLPTTRLSKATLTKRLTSTLCTYFLRTTLKIGKPLY